MHFKLNCGYQAYIFYKKKIIPYFYFRIVEKVLAKSKKFIIIC